MKKIVTALLAVLIFAAGAFAADYPAKLAIPYVKAPLNVPSIVAKYNKSFEAAYPGVALSFPELTEGPKQTAALAAGEPANSTTSAPGQGPGVTVWPSCCKSAVRSVSFVRSVLTRIVVLGFS